MANLKHMDIIKRGVDSWNSWRVNNSHILPSLSEAGLHMAYLNKANLSRADLSDAGLRLADLIEANLKGADLYWANLSEANLRGANIRGANLQGANLTGSNLHGCKLNSANMQQANISRADIRNTELVRANLCGADLSGADLSGAIIKEANLIGANLTGAKLDGADMSCAIVGSTLFGNANLSNVEGLESLVHVGPSTVGIDTIYKSRGRVPMVFLKNAGVPSHLIDYIEMFVDQKKKHYSCFISYTEKNEDFAHKLFDDLQTYGIRCWIATEKLKRRDRNHAIIDSAVKLHDKNILILSGDSIEHDWVENEYHAVVEREIQEGKNVLVLISLDDAVKYSEKPWVAKMRRSRYIADFSMWEDNQIYRNMLESLLEGLQADENPCDAVSDFSEEEFYEEDQAPVKVTETEARSEASEFRAERRQFY